MTTNLSKQSGIPSRLGPHSSSKQVRDGWHHARQNSAHTPHPQAIFRANELTVTGYISLCPPRVHKKISGSQSTVSTYLASPSLHQNDLGIENPKDLERSKTWQRSTTCCKLSTHIVPERMLQAAGTHHIASLPWAQHRRPSHTPHSDH